MRACDFCLYSHAIVYERGVTKVKKSALLEAPLEVAYKVVADVERYPEFLPGCHTVEIRKCEEDVVEAKVTVQGSGMTHAFVTTNTNESKSIKMVLKEGPFKRLVGAWSFKAIGDLGCRVEIEIDYELAGGLDLMLGGLVRPLTNKMVDAFSHRIEEAASDETH